MGILLGLIVTSSWYFTILSGFYILYSPVFYLMFLNHGWYRKVVDFLFSLWELYPVALFQWCCGTKLHTFGDQMDSNETNIIVMNHRTRVDWNYVWIALYHATQIGHTNTNNYTNRITETFGGKAKTKYVLKDEIKSVPGLGWIMQLNFFLFVKRNWQTDQVHLNNFVDYYKRLKCNIRVLIFPEGTDLSRQNLVRSEKFALANNLPAFNHVLHPRTTGFASLCARLRSAGLAAVYDVTVAYDRPPQTEADLLRGRLPQHVYFHFKRYPVLELPADEEGLRNWLKDRWAEKEESLQKFHSEGSFVDATGVKQKQQKCRSLVTAQVVFVFWTLIDIGFIYFAINSLMFQFWIFYNTLLFVFVTCYFGGFQYIQYKLVENI